MTKSKLATGVVMAGLAAAVVFQYQTSARLKSENKTLSEKADQLDQLRAENERLAGQPKAQPGMNEDQLKELLRLRSEVGRLQRELAEALKVKPEIVPPPKADSLPSPAEEHDQQEKITKLTQGKQWVLACTMFAHENEGRYPTNFRSTR